MADPFAMAVNVWFRTNIHFFRKDNSEITRERMSHRFIPTRVGLCDIRLLIRKKTLIVGREQGFVGESVADKQRRSPYKTPQKHS